MRNSTSKNWARLIRALALLLLAYAFYDAASTGIMVYQKYDLLPPMRP